MPRDKRRPWTAFYWADWLADPDVRMLSRDERGAYMDVLAYTHQTDTPGIATEDQVRRWAGYSPAEWLEHRVALACCFLIEGGQWTQERTVREFSAGEMERKRLASFGRKGGRASQERSTTSTQRLDLGPSLTPARARSESESESESESKALPGAVRVAQASALAGSDVKIRAHVPEGEVNTPRDGERQNGLVWFRGGWRSQTEAEFLGWGASPNQGG